VAIGDLNVDGKPDLAVANSVSNTVSVLLGNGDGTLGANTEFGTGYAPLCVAIGDLNGGGQPDLVAANSGDNTVSVLLGNGDGTFQTHADFGTGRLPSSVVIGGLNGDGRLDLAIANYGSNTISALVNVGGGMTATLLAQFDAVAGAEGVELRWSFGDGSRVASVTIERAPAAEGPWVPITPELREEGEVTTALDRTADPGQANFYRLIARLVDGTSATFGPVSSTGSAPIVGSDMMLVGPNPTREGARIRYAVARAGSVRLAVVDVSGRVVTSLVDVIQPPGRYELAWDGTNGGRRLSAGLYFVRLTAPDRSVVRKLATIR